MLKKRLALTADKWSNGAFTQRRDIPASAEKSIAAKSFAKNFGYAAAAIMAALSVESGRVGKYTGTPAFAACSSNC